VDLYGQIGWFETTAVMSVTDLAEVAVTIEQIVTREAEESEEEEE
jgi:hypothetical protein